MTLPVAQYVYSFAALLGTYVVFKISKAYILYRRMDGIPSVGSSGFWWSYVDGFRYMVNAEPFIQEGYAKYYGRPFKVPTIARWEVILSGPKLLEDIRRAKDEEINFHEAGREFLNTDYTLGPTDEGEHFQIDVIRGALTRNIAAQFPEIHDEVIASFEELIPASKGWVTVPAVETIMKIACRTSNRYFIGLPLCRNEEYLDLNTRFTVELFKAAMLLNLFPPFMRGFVAQFVSCKKSLVQAEKLIGPMIKERLEKEKALGNDYPDRPNDFISWTLDVAPPEYCTVSQLVKRVLMLNFAAIHTTSMTFSHSMYRIVAHPECLGPLREEIESVVKEHGWTKAAMQKMIKLDSFLRESQRVLSIPGRPTGIMRIVKKDTRLSDGTLLPAGSFLTLALTNTHFDERNYESPEEFRPFRYSDKRMSEEDSYHHQTVTPAPEYLRFGYGRHACPGRFFAANEIKLFLAHALVTYDIQFDDSKPVPPPYWMASVKDRNPNVHLMFKKRV